MNMHIFDNLPPLLIPSTDDPNIYVRDEIWNTFYRKLVLKVEIPESVLYLTQRLQDQLNQMEQKLRDSQKKLNVSRQELDVSRQELDVSRQELDVSRQELDACKQKLRVFEDSFMCRAIAKLKRIGKN